MTSLFRLLRLQVGALAADCIARWTTTDTTRTQTPRRTQETRHEIRRHRETERHRERQRERESVRAIWRTAEAERQYSEVIISD
uniref:Putative secreted protein n=1 Tax=Anopheles triannulatus TaxID=58253 RepID=A0A2M4B4Z2_9DIPT